VGLAFGNGVFSGSADPSVEFLLRAWVWPPARDWPAHIAIGVIVSFAGYCLAQAYRTADAGLVAPFEYVAMPLSILFGVIFFGTWPAPVAWLGIALIAGSGLYVFFRETMRGRQKAGAVTPST
jgi:drug/metabolite transporter (DMT)-like permease